MTFMGKLDIIMCSHTRVIISMRFPLDDDGDAASAVLEKRLLPVEGQYRREIDASHLGEQVRGWRRKAGAHLSSLGTFSHHISGDLFLVFESIKFKLFLEFFLG